MGDCQPQAKPIHFFKIILAQSLLEGKLMIPRMFVKKYGDGLPKTVFLKLPNGAEWKVHLAKRDGEIWFQKGWKEFAEYHSLAQGHLLVFRYESTSYFPVQIFDMSALEIDYPSKRVEGERASDDQGNNPPKDENLEDYRPCSKRKDNKSLEFLQPCKMRRSNRCVKVESTFNLTNAALHHTGRKCIEGGPGVSTSKFLKCKVQKNSQQPMTTAEQMTALDRACSFKSCNPYFLVIIQPSHINSHGSPTLPSKFAKSHFNLGKKRGNINLRVPNGRVWPARYIIRKFNTRTRSVLSGGWKAFAKGNNLKIGDVCIFELIGSRREITFRVFIFRETDNSNCPMSQESAQTRIACQGQRKGLKIKTKTTKSSPPGKFTALARSLKLDPVSVFKRVS